jgi:hypothetical protein
VVLTPKELVYIQDLSAWPAQLIGREIVATGVLTRQKGMADQDENGAFRQVIVNDWYQLEQAIWRPAD